MPLTKSDTIGTWIKDFKKSDAPQFSGKSAKERRDMAVAAYLSAKKGVKGESVQEAGMPSSVIKNKQRNAEMSHQDFAAKHKDKSDDELRSMARRHGYGKGSNYYVNKRNKGLKGESVGEARVLRSLEDPTRDRRGWRITSKRLNRHLRNTTKDVEKSDKSMGEGKKYTGKDSKGHFRATEKGAGMTQKGVDAVNRKTGGNLKTAVTTKPSKLKKDSKAANRRKSYCARSAGQLKMWPKAAKDPNSRLRQARRRWNC